MSLLHKPSEASFTVVSDDEQLELLNAQLTYAAAHSPYHREVLGSAPQLTSLAQLRELPFMSVETLKAQGGRLSCVSAADVARIVSLRTSGTTEAPKRLFFTQGDLARTVDFFCEGMQWMSGRGDRVAIFFPGEGRDGLNDLLSRGLSAFGALPRVYGAVCDAAEMAALVAKECPNVMIGMPWQIRALAVCFPELRPETVLLSADYVPQSLCEFLEERWGCRALVHFGMTESGYGFAVQHPLQPGMYYRRSDFYAEIIDPQSGEPLPFGEVGELVFTTLRREAMPLIRYRTGDWAVMSDDKKIARIPGRIGNADGFYELQERLAPLPWLIDYAVKNGVMETHVTSNAPNDCAQQLALLSGCTVHCSVSMRMLVGGKRS